LLFSFSDAGVTYPCALVHWFVRVGDTPDEDTGMWIVEPEIIDDDGRYHLTVLHLDSILRAAHLIGVYGEEFIGDVDPSLSLDMFDTFYVNKFVDHHANEIAF